MLLLSRSLRCAIFVAREAARIFTTTVDIEEDLRRIALQEERLQFHRFGASSAWDLGKRLKEIGEVRKLAIVIDIQLETLPLFYLALQGTTPDNPEWVRRKRNIVRRFHRSSYAIGLMAKQQKINPHSALGDGLRGNDNGFRIAPARGPFLGRGNSRRLPGARSLRYRTHTRLTQEKQRENAAHLERRSRHATGVDASDQKRRR